MRIYLNKTPYVLAEKAEHGLLKQISYLEERVATLRHSGKLTDNTVRKYYGEKKYEQVAESNAIEGSTLSARETELAVLKGVTTTGHDPAYVKDAISLEKALTKLVEMAKNKNQKTNKTELLALHELILSERPTAGMFRGEPVRIRGATHRPPKTREAVLNAMDDWEQWSIDNPDLPALVRGVVLHAWLVHIHPFIDGNGRTARAITNLELVKAGYPPIIIRKKERDRYIEALAESDEGGDIRSFFELLIERADGALTGLELSAKSQQDFDPVIEKTRMRQEKNLRIWETSVALLVKTLEYYLAELLDKVGGKAYIRVFESSLDLDDYISLSEGKSISRSWCFIVNVSIPGIDKLERLAYIGYRQPHLRYQMNHRNGPAIYWSIKNPDGYPKWITNTEKSPYCTEMTTKEGAGDAWTARLLNGAFKNLSTTELANNLARNLVDLTTS